MDTTSERQSQNGLVKRTRISTPETSHSYPKERKIPRDYWYYVIYHFTQILNICVGKMNRRLITPHELLYGDKTDAQTWFPLLYVGYLHHQRDGTVTRSSTHYQTLAGITIGQATKYNVINFYNPVTRSIYTTGYYALNLG